MDETRYSFDQISKASGIERYLLEERRKQAGVPWHAKGYTVEEVIEILQGATLWEYAMINPRAYKAQELWDKLNLQGAVSIDRTD